MRLSVVTALSALAVASQALLVPLESYAAEESKAFSALIAGGSIPLVFPCPGCPLQTIDENGVEGWSKDVKNSLLLNFTLSHNSDVLFLNELPLYPPHRFPLPPLLAAQIRDTAKPQDAYAHLVNLGYELSILPEASTAKPDEHVITLELHVVQLNSLFVTGIPSIELQLVKKADGHLLWHDMQVKDAVLPPSPSEVEKKKGEKECKSLTLLCKWKALLGDRLATLKAAHAKGCHSLDKHRSHGKGGAKKFGQGHAGGKHGGLDDKTHWRQGGHGRHGHSGHRGHHGHHSHMRAAWRKYGWVVSRIIFPVTVGILAGLTVSAIGIIFGHLLSSIYLAIFRCRHCEYAALEQTENLDGEHVLDVKEALMNELPLEYMDLEEGGDKAKE